MMAEYLLGDLSISSALPLSALRRVPPATLAPSVTVTRRRGRTRPPDVRRWHHEWIGDDGRRVIGLALDRSGYLLRFPRTCDFLISGDGRRVNMRPHRLMAPETLEHLLADQVLPRCLAHGGELVVHAAGVAIGPEIALFVGETGRGKSTLAGLFLRVGRTVLTDDCLMLRPTPAAVRALPTYPSLRLCPDSVDALFPGDLGNAALPSYSDKQRFSLPNASHQAAGGRVAALYFLGEADTECTDFKVGPLAPATSCIRLMEQTFQLDVLDRDAVKRLLGRAGEIVARVPSFTLDFPRDFRRAAELLAGIERHFASIDRHPSAP